MVIQRQSRHGVSGPRVGSRWSGAAFRRAVAIILVASAGHAAHADTASAGLRLGTPQPHGLDTRPPALVVDLGFVDADRIVARRANGIIEVWDLPARDVTETLHTEGVFAQGGAHVIYAAGGRLHLRRIGGPASGRPLPLPAPSDVYGHAALSRHGDRLLLGQAPDRLELWATTPLTLQHRWRTSRPLRNGIALAPDGDAVAAAVGSYTDATGHAGAVDVWRRPIATMPRQTFDRTGDSIILGMWRLRLGATGRLMATTSQHDGRAGVGVWDVETNALVWSVDGLGAYWVRGLALSDDGRRLAAGDEKGNVTVWQIGTGRRLFTRQRDMVVQSVAFSPDGRRLAAAYWDATLEIFNVDGPDEPADDAPRPDTP